MPTSAKDDPANVRSTADTSGERRFDRRTSQTLSRGLAVLRSVALEPRGLTATDLAAATGLDRTVVHRLLNTLVLEGFAEHTAGGVYRAGPEMRSLAALSGPSITDVIQPLLQALADRHSGTAMLCLAEPDAIVAAAVAVPLDADSHLSYRRGSRHPIDRGAGARAILAGRPRRDGEAPEITEARASGWTAAHGEVEAGAYAVAAPISHEGDLLDACVMFVSHRPDSVRDATQDITDLAQAVRVHLTQGDGRRDDSAGVGDRGRLDT
jgi:DNA-binding IclR family transcriptional regulator